MSNMKKGTLGEILAASQIISDNDVAAALEEQKRSGVRFGEALINLGIVAQEDIDWALSNQLDLPYIRLKKEMIDPEAVAMLTPGMARSYNCIPLIKAGGELNVALADPLNKLAITEIERHTGCSVNVSMALFREIREMLDIFYGVDRHDSMGFESTAFSAAVMETINADISGTKLLHYLLVFVQQNRISSLALQPLGETILIRGKRGGATHTVGSLAANHYPELVQRIRKEAELPSTHRGSQTGILPFAYRGTPVRLMVATTTGEGGEYITIHPCSSYVIPRRLAELNPTPQQQSAFLQLANAPRGMTFVASRNLQDRSRMIDLLLEERTTDNSNVLILGSGPGRMNKRFPRIPLPEGERDAARLIRDLLDHAPDLLVIEDATDQLPFAAACRIAMRGVAVLAGVEQYNLKSALRQLHLYSQKQLILPIHINGVVSFKGIQLLCPHCRTPFAPPAEELTIMQLPSPPAAFYRSAGCPACSGSGTSERRLLLDLLVCDEPFIQMFEQARDQASIDEYLLQSGYQGSERDGLELLMNGQVSPDEYIASIIL